MQRTLKHCKDPDNNHFLPKNAQVHLKSQNLWGQFQLTDNVLYFCSAQPRGDDENLTVHIKQAHFNTFCRVLADYHMISGNAHFP